MADELSLIGHIAFRVTCLRYNKGKFRTKRSRPCYRSRSATMQGRELQ